ncbi:MAG: hypothetical protein JL50_02895 [Peptococcaceae bacterium BICA1-7]|nr:MAG: hypothetical protein JL50_02895 [Peptococcaceae bacterium BICA1-7]HBV97788.1 hypothetical protein [Desulfotomaculum sp.]
MNEDQYLNYGGIGGYSMGFFDSPFVPLIVGMIALVFMAPLVDALFKVFQCPIQKILDRFRWLPNSIADEAAFVIVVGIGYLICWQGDFDFFAYLNFNFDQTWKGYLLTSLTISGGTAALKDKFDLMNLIPMSVSGVYSSVTRIIRKDADKNANGQAGQ